MKRTLTICRHTLSGLWLTAAGCVVAAGVLLTLLRFATPLTAAYTPQIVAAVSAALGQPLRVAAFEPQWHGLGPVLVFKDMQILDHEGGRPVLRFSEARIDIDVFDSLLRWRLADSHLTVKGIAITVVRRADGRLGVAGFGNVPASDRAGDALAVAQRWLEAQRRISITGSDVYWRDDSDPGAAPLHFSQADLELRNSGGRHVVGASMTLPHEFGQRLQVVADVRGPLLDAGHWDGRVYVSARGANLARLAGARRVVGVGVADGAADLRAWGAIGAGRLQELEGELQVQGLRLTGDGDGAHVSGLGGRFRWQAFDGGWSLDADKVWLAAAGDVTPPTRFRVFSQRRGDGYEIDTEVGSLRVQDVLPLVRLSDRLPAAVRAALDSARPRGTLSQTYLHVTTGSGSAPPYLYSRFSGVATGGAWGALPPVAGLDGIIQGSPAAGRLDVDSRRVVLAGGAVFRRQLQADISGRLAWRRDAGGWRVTSPGLSVSNADIKARARFAVAGAAGRRPFVDLAASFSDGNIAHASRYLPAGKMHPKLVDWLDRALVGGHIKSGGLLLHGDLADFPFDHHRGTFEVRFDVEDGILNFHDAWPRVDQMQAQIVFRGHSLEVDADHGRMLHSTIAPATARIADLTAKPAVLTVTGKAAGPAGDALSIATGTPLNQRIGRYLRGLQVGGHCNLDLALTLPLMQPATRIDGTLAFEDGTLEFPRKITLSHVGGPLHFTAKTLDAHGMTATILGYPATIDAGTLKTPQTRMTWFEARGQTDVAHLQGLEFVDLPFMHALSGRTAWRAKLQLSEAAADGRVRPALLVDTTLAGIAAAMPAPLGKAAADKVPLTVRVDDLGEPAPPVSFRYGRRLSGALRMDGDGGIDRAELRLGDGGAVLPAARGIMITGTADRLSVGEWRDFFAHQGQASGAGRGRPGRGGIIERVSNVDVKVERLQALDHRFDHVDLRALRQGGGWRLQVASDQLKGRIDAPDNGRSPVVMDLDYLKLTSGALDAGPRRQPDPRDLYPVRLHSKRLVYDGHDLGAFRLQTSRISGGMHVDEMKLSSSTMQAAVSGDWYTDDAGQVSAFTATIKSQDIGASLTSFGYAGTIKNGRGDAVLSGTWRGGPFNMDVSTMDGSIALEVHGGRLLDIDPGAGRILGILSVQALPRRLTLDFSDLFEKGFAVDSIRGDFAVKDGNAYTDDMVMQAPAAKVKVKGRVGLATRDYDQDVAVMPHLIGGLPLVGVLASGPAAGVAILVLQKLFEDQINDIMRVDYTVTGPWDKPVVERVQKDIKPPAAAG